MLVFFIIKDSCGYFRYEAKFGSNIDKNSDWESGTC
jgi:hypothetical protein